MIPPLPRATLISLFLLAFFGVIEAVKALRVASPAGKKRELLSTLFIVLSGAIWAVSFLDSALWRLPPKPLFPYATTAGLVLFSAGIAVRIIAFRELGRFYNYMLTIEPDHKLITSGIYSKIRHPLYLGTLLLFLGFPLANGSLLGLLLFALLGIPAVAYRIRREEQMLHEAFPKTYQNYSRKTGRVLPFYKYFQDQKIQLEITKDFGI